MDVDGGWGLGEAGEVVLKVYFWWGKGVGWRGVLGGLFFRGSKGFGMGVVLGGKVWVGLDT